MIVSGLALCSIVLCDVVILYGIAMLIRNTIVILRTEKIVNENVTGIVTRKEYHDSYYQYVSVGKTFVPIHHPETFYIVVNYNGRELYFESEEKYDMVTVGDEVRLVMIKRLDKNGKEIDVEFELEE